MLQPSVFDLMLDWERVSALPWRQRNAEVEAAVREFLGMVDPRVNAAMPTMTVARKLLCYPEDHPHVAKLAHLLTRLAPYLAPFAQHDGEKIKRYGKTWQRWNWYGQGGAT